MLRILAVLSKDAYGAAQSCLDYVIASLPLAVAGLAVAGNDGFVGKHTVQNGRTLYDRASSRVGRPRLCSVANA